MLTLLGANDIGDITHIILTQNQDKMKTKLKNIALEGTCSGDVVGGLLSWTGDPSGAFFLQKGVEYR